MKNIIRQWAKLIPIPQNPQSIRAVPNTQGTVAIPEIINHEQDNYVPVVGSKCLWYNIETSRYDVKLTVNDDDLITINRQCEVCNHPYPVKIKAWKIRSCNYAAAPCPKCNVFQTVDLAALRKEDIGKSVAILKA